MALKRKAMGIGLAGIAAIGGWLSYTHIQKNFQKEKEIVIQESMPKFFKFSDRPANQHFPFTLEQLLEKEKVSMDDTLLPQFVQVPENQDPNKWKYIVVYGTAIGNKDNPEAQFDEKGNPNTWCGPCNALAREKTYEKIKEHVLSVPNTGIIKLLHPPSHIKPSYFEHQKAVPVIEILKNENKKLYALAQIKAQTIKEYAEKTNNIIDKLNKNGKIEEIILYEEDFKKLKVEYSVEQGDVKDHLAIAIAKAKFPEAIKSEKPFIVELDCSDPEQFAFALETNSSPNLSCSRGRNIFEVIGQEVVRYGVKAQEKNSLIKNRAEQINNLLIIRSEMPDIQDYAKKHAEAFSEFFDFSLLFVPPYIKPMYQNFVEYSKKRHLGELENYLVIEDLISPNIEKKFENWAKANGKNLKINYFSFGNHENVDATLKRIGEVFSYLRNEGIEYCFDEVPKPVLDELIREKPYALLRVGKEPIEDFIREIEEWQRNPSLEKKSPYSASAMLSLSSEIKDKGNITFIMIPYVNTRLGFADIPQGSIARYADGFGGDQDAPAHILLYNGNYLYTPFGIATAKEAIKKINEKIK